MHNIPSKLEIDIWEEKRKTEIESSKWEIINKRVITFRVKRI